MESPFDIIFLGGTGDLTWRKLIPALYQAFRHGALDDGRILGCARDPLDSDAYRNLLWQRFETLSWEEPLDEAAFRTFARAIEYLPLDLRQPASYANLAAWVRQRNSEAVVIYLATAPELFCEVCDGLAAQGLNDPRVRVVLEKPLGVDLRSAIAINESVRRHFAEHQIFRIDHYLGKQSVQNLMALRFGNALFEPLWRRETIANVQITIDEELGVEGRGGYYDKSGALRDMVQNHLLQLLCTVAMEPPVADDADAIRDEKLKVLRALRPYTAEQVEQFVVRGQYRAGIVQGKPVPGYLEESGVPPESTTETFVALRAEIDNWRWAGVPFFLRTGKRLARRSAEIVVNFRPVPHTIFEEPAGQHHNRLVIRLQPDDSVELHLLAKASNRAKAEQGRLAPAKLDLDFRETFGKETIEAYERLLRKVIAGRLDLFVRYDEQIAAWRWVEPILTAWAADATPLRPYAAGTWGPNASIVLTAREGTSWPEHD
jgi:glucose-6-phosphate 1-dehydrogenase